MVVITHKRRRTTMNNRRTFNLYIGATISLIIIASVLTYYFTSKTEDNGEKYKGYQVTFTGGHTCWDDLTEIKKLRQYKDFSLTSDSIKNDSVLSVVRTYLNNIKDSNDSIHGVHIEMTNDMPYKYYLDAIEIFNEKPPRLFAPFDNHFYALGKSRYQMRKDSLDTAITSQLNYY